MGLVSGRNRRDLGKCDAVQWAGAQQYKERYRRRRQFGNVRCAML